MSTNTASAARAHEPESGFGTPLSAGLTDRFGERWITSDAADGTPLELLRFRAELAEAPGFEDALRTRVRLLAGFKDPAFASVRDLIKEGDRLTLISTHVSGQRLSDVSAGLSKGKRLPFVIRLLRDATRALAALEAVAPGVTHGALTGDRILLTPEGRVCISEHALAPALQELALWPEELWTDFGLVARRDEEGEATFDPATTVAQLALVALSILLARQMTLRDFEQRLPELLDEVGSLSSGPSSSTVMALREWLERALHVHAEPFATSADAESGLRKLLAATSPASAVDLDAVPFPPRPEVAGEKSAVAREIPAKSESKPPRPPEVAPISQEPIQEVERPTPASARDRYLLWAAIGLAVVAIGEGAALTRLVTRPPTVVLTDSSITVESGQAGETVLVDGKPVGSTPLKVRVNPKTQAIRVVAAAAPAPVIEPSAVAAKTESDKTAAALEQAAARQRSGGIAITTPIPLTVLEGNRVLGSTTDGPIVATAGRHQLDFVNAALGYRTQQAVTIRAGVIAPLTITPPMGRLSINAQPWAQVLIDDTPVGETPLANVPVSIGEHQVTFRHPQMGERRERVTVRADTPARVSTTFQR